MCVESLFVLWRFLHLMAQKARHQVHLTNLQPPFTALSGHNNYHRSLSLSPPLCHCNQLPHGRSGGAALLQNIIIISVPFGAVKFSIFHIHSFTLSSNPASCWLMNATAAAAVAGASLYRQNLVLAMSPERGLDLGGRLIQFRIG